MRSMERESLTAERSSLNIGLVFHNLQIVHLIDHGIYRMIGHIDIHLDTALLLRPSNLFPYELFIGCGTNGNLVAFAVAFWAGSKFLPIEEVPMLLRNLDTLQTIAAGTGLAVT